MANKPGKLSFVAQHKVLTIVSVLGVLILGTVIYTSLVQYSHKFSKEDYDTLTSKAETVLKNTSGQDVQVSRRCSYERPAEFASLHLYCSIAMVTYLPYESDAHTIAVARTYEKEIQAAFGPEIKTFSRIYEAPRDRLDTAVIVLSKPHYLQCNFYIATNRWAETDSSDEQILRLPKQHDGNLIALKFGCGTESRSEYFTVTYRQS